MESTFCIIMCLHCIAFFVFLCVIESLFAIWFLILFFGFMIIGVLFEKKEEQERLKARYKK